MHFPFLIYCALLVATEFANGLPYLHKKPLFIKITTKQILIVFGLVLSVPSHATNCQFTSKRPFHVKGENGLIRRGHVLPQQAKQQLHLPRGGPEADKPGGKCPPPFGPLKGNRPMTGHCIHTTQQREGKASASSQSADSQNTEMLDTSPYNIENVVIVGTGLMGTGIAQVAIESGMKVTVVGRGQEKCEVARQKVFAGVQKSTKRRLAAESAEKQQQVMAAAMEALDFVSELDEADLAGADLVVEAVVENLKVKQKLFVDLESRVSERCLLVTNTSSFLLEDVSAKMDKCRQNFGGLHFFNPVPAMKLVEVVRGNDTSEEAYDALFRFCQRIGKTPVKCADSPGFIVNRLLIPYLADAMRLAESGNATPRDIDTAMRLGTGHPMGPFELMDYIGLDTMKFIMDGWHQRCPDDHRYTPCESLDKLVAAGKMGRKGGEGFYRYASK